MHKILTSLFGILRLPLRLLRKLPWPRLCRSHPYWTGALLTFVTALAVLVFVLSRPKSPEYVTEEVARGDIVRTVEAVGSVISERDLALQFPVTGIVSEVLVREGNSVKAGQRLATLRGGTLGADVASASAALQSAQADLSALVEGTRPEDILIAEAELMAKRASLTVAKTELQTAERKLEASDRKLASLQNEADISLGGTISAVGSIASEQIIDARTALKAIDDVFESIVVSDVIQKFTPSAYADLKTRQRNVTATLADALSTTVVSANYDEALLDLSTARVAVAAAAEVLRQASDLLLNLPITATFSVSARDTQSDTIAAERASVQGAVSALDAAINDLRDASASYRTQISAEESLQVSAQGEADLARADIATYEAAVQVAESQLALKRAGARPQDIASARARVAEQAARVQRARAAYGDTQLLAPVDGIITKVLVKQGEALPSGPAITMLGDAPYRIETYLAEVDVPLIALAQSGSIEIDAFPSVYNSLILSEIDEAATDRDGVPKYRVKLDFVSPRQDLRVGMTGDTEIITGLREDVLFVPRRAVIEGGDGSRMVRVLRDGTIDEVPVTTGMEGSDGEIEVEGVEEGDTVIVLIRE
jgi:RND family efflux transporter MFP subunit